MKYALFLFIFLLSSCAKNKSEKIEIAAVIQNNELYKISNYDYKSSVDLSPYIKNVNYVKLELTDESMLGEICSLEAFEDKLYIFDDVTGSVFVFSKEGNFLFTLNNVGQGPGEYTQIDFFSIDRNERQMVVADLMSNNIFRYDLNGKFISKQKVPCWLDGVYPIENKSFVSFTNYRNNSDKIENQQNILFIDLMSNISCGYFPYPSEDITKLKFLVPVNGGFYYGGNVCNYFHQYQDTVYSVSDKTLKPKYVFDFGNKNFDKSYLLKDATVLEDYIESRKCVSLRSLNETEDYLFYSVADEWVINTGLFSKKTGNNILASTWYDGNDQIISYPIATYESSVICSVSALRLFNQKKFYEENGWPEGKFVKQKKEFMDTLSEDDNPILVFYEFDDF